MERQLRDHIAKEAADFFVRLQDPADTAARTELAEWLLRSPMHVEEFLAITRTWGEAMPDDTTGYSIAELTAAAAAERPAAGNVVSIIDAAFEPEAAVASVSSDRGRRRFGARPVAMAAVVAVIVGALGWLIATELFGPSRISTAIGEQRSVTLADGSVIDINTGSAIRVDVGKHERLVYLLRGEARFKVAKDPARPFIVSTSQATVRAVGTVFNVRAQPERTAVAVLEGRVEVREIIPPPAVPDTKAPAQPDAASTTPPPIATPIRRDRLELNAGQQAIVTDAGDIVPNAGPPIERVAMWTQRRLVFRSESLADVVAEFNRYHTRPIVIEDPALAAVRISGTFDSSDPRSLVEYLQQFERARAEESADAIRLRAIQN